MKRSLVFLLFVFLATSIIPSSALAQDEPCFEGAWILQSITDPEGEVTGPGDLGYIPQIQFLSDHSYARLQNMVIVAQGLWQTGTVWVEYQGGLICLDTLSSTTGDSWHSPRLVDTNILELCTGVPGSETVERYAFLAPTPLEVVNWGSVKTIYR